MENDYSVTIIFRVVTLFQFNSYRMIWIHGYSRIHTMYKIITLCEGVIDDKLFWGKLVSDGVFLQGHCSTITY